MGIAKQEIEYLFEFFRTNPCHDKIHNVKQPVHLSIAKKVLRALKSLLDSKYNHVVTGLLAIVTRIVLASIEEEFLSMVYYIRHYLYMRSAQYVRTDLEVLG